MRDLNLITRNTLLLILIIGFTEAKVIRQAVDGLQYYEEKLLAEVNTMPYMLSVDYKTNKLFYSYTDISNDDANQAAYLDLKSKKTYKIKGVDGGFANAVDNEHHKVYIGGSDGIYQFDYETKTGIHLGANNHSVWHAFYKNGLHYTTYEEKKAYAWINGAPVLVEKLKDVKVDMFVADSEGTMYVANDKGLYKYEAKEDASNPKFLCDVKPVALIIHFDNDRVFFSDSHYIYTLTNDECDKLVHLDDIYGLSMDQYGRFIYSNKYNIYRLKLTGVCDC